jgi:ubiquitin carboxyl-terminal hydrolase 48
VSYFGTVKCSSYLQVVKENQRLHVLLKELVDDSATLSDLNILPGSYLWVMDTGLHENRDIAGIESNPLFIQFQCISDLVYKCVISGFSWIV